MQTRTLLRRIVGFVALVALAAFLAACGSGGTDIEEVSYDLNEANGSGVSGTITFTRAADSEVTVDIDLDGTEDGFTHPAHVHASDSGAIYVFLPFVNGTTGEAAATGELTVADTYTPPPGEAPGAVVDYDDLTSFDGYVNIHLGGPDATPDAQGDLAVVATGEIGAAVSGEED